MSRVRPGSGSIMVPQGTSCTGGMAPWPRAASSGAPTVDSAIMAASGFPGSPSTKRPSGSSARTAGWPGRMATPSITSRPPEFRDGTPEVVGSGAARYRRW